MRLDAFCNVLLRHRTQRAQHVEGVFSGTGLASFGKELSSRDDATDDRRIQLQTFPGLAEQLRQQGGINGQRGGTLCGIAFVHKRADVGEQQRLGERTGSIGGDLRDTNRPCTGAAKLVQHLGERVEFVHIMQALAHGLHHDGKLWVLAGNIQQLRGPLALLPQRLALAWVASWQ